MLQLTRAGQSLTIRVTNLTGHKLPTGYPEGRRMWINVRFLAEQNTTDDWGRKLLQAWTETGYCPPTVMAQEQIRL